MPTLQELLEDPDYKALATANPEAAKGLRQKFFDQVVAWDEEYQQLQKLDPKRAASFRSSVIDGTPSAQSVTPPPADVPSLEPPPTGLNLGRTAPVPTSAPEQPSVMSRVVKDVTSTASNILGAGRERFGEAARHFAGEGPEYKPSGNIARDVVVNPAKRAALSALNLLGVPAAMLGEASAGLVRGTEVGKKVLPGYKDLTVEEGARLLGESAGDFLPIGKLGTVIGRKINPVRPMERSFLPLNPQQVEGLKQPGVRETMPLPGEMPTTGQLVETKLGPLPARAAAAETTRYERPPTILGRPQPTTTLSPTTGTLPSQLEAGLQTSGDLLRGEQEVALVTHLTARTKERVLGAIKGTFRPQDLSPDELRVYNALSSKPGLIEKLQGATKLTPELQNEVNSAAMDVGLRGIYKVRGALEGKIPIEDLSDAERQAYERIKALEVPKEVPIQNAAGQPLVDPQGVPLRKPVDLETPKTPEQTLLEPGPEGFPATSRELLRAENRRLPFDRKGREASDAIGDITGTFYSNPFWPQKDLVIKSFQNPAARAVAGGTAGFIVGGGDSTSDINLGQRIMGAVIGATLAGYGPKLIGKDNYYNRAKAKIRSEVPSIVGPTPSEVAKGNPDATKLVRLVQDRADIADGLEGTLTTRAKNIYKDILRNGSKDDITTVHKLLDTEGVTAQTLAASGVPKHILNGYAELRSMFDEIAELLGLPTGERITHYFPRLRQVWGTLVQKIVKVADKDIPEYITEVLPKELHRWFLKERTANAPADDLSVAPVMAYLRGTARQVAFMGGFLPDAKTGAKIVLGPVADDINPILPKITDSRVRDYFTTYVKRNMGVRESNIEDAISPDVSAKLRTWQFVRTLGFNPLGAALNLTQLGLTFANSPVTASINGTGAAVKTLYKWFRRMPEGIDAVNEYRRLGIIDKMSKADEDFLRSLFQTSKVEEIAGRVTSSSSKMFRGTENLNRIVTYEIGKSEALKKGLSLEEAHKFGVQKVRDNQFLFGKEDLPLSFSDPLGPNLLGAVRRLSTRQYKPFVINYMQSLKDLYVNDLKDLGRLMTEGPQLVKNGQFKQVVDLLPKRVAKYQLFTLAMFGSSPAFYGMDEEISQALTGDRKALTTNGLLGMMGLSLGHAISMGAMPIEDIGSFLFFLPGPMLASVFDGASIAASLHYGRQINLNPVDIIRDGHVDPGKPIDPNRMAGKLARLFNLQADRLRKAVVEGRAEDQTHYRRPVTNAQAWGVTPIPKTAPLASGAVEEDDEFLPKTTKRVLKSAIGGQELEKFTEREQISKQITETTEYKAALGRAVELLVAGETELAKEYIKKHKLVITPEAIKGAISRSALPPALREFKRTPLPLRGGAMENLIELRPFRSKQMEALKNYKENPDSLE